ncbi:hypothetical protein DL93DRAFT_2173455 [Clavulina sp. PMI_390]|nr:hypothetical protein DL93DRAFT_2173455 [Clavulina sp. PMI_390]
MFGTLYGLQNHAIHSDAEPYNPFNHSVQLIQQKYDSIIAVFQIGPLPEGYFYTGPTDNVTTQNPCICSTPVYTLLSACGACQNRSYSSWSGWSEFCPTKMLSPEGEYSSTIPIGTRVPAYAFLKPSYYNDFFNPTAARQLGDLPESTHISTATTTSTISGTSSLGGGGGGGSNLGAIVGGVVGGVTGLGLLVLLGFWFARQYNRPVRPSSADGPMVTHTIGDNTRPMTAARAISESHGNGSSYVLTQYAGAAGQRYYDPRGTFPASPTPNPPYYSGMPEF